MAVDDLAAPGVQDAARRVEGRVGLERFHFGGGNPSLSCQALHELDLALRGGPDERLAAHDLALEPGDARVLPAAGGAVGLEGAQMGFREHDVAAGAVGPDVGFAQIRGELLGKIGVLDGYARPSADVAIWIGALAASSFIPRVAGAGNAIVRGCDCAEPHTEGAGDSLHGLGVRGLIAEDVLALPERDIAREELIGDL